MGNARNHWKSSKTSVATCKRERAWVSQHPPSAPSKNSRSGISWMGWNCLFPRGQFTWSVYLFFFCSFFSLAQFFFPCKGFFYHFFFWPAPDPKFFVGSSYLLQPPTALLPTNPPTSLFLLAPSPTHLLLRSLPSLELLTWREFE
jgi:hypothetical protein